MANESKLDTELESVALRIYVERAGNRNAIAFGSEQIAAACFREAEAFLAVRDKVRNKELSTAVDSGPKLSEASAPNLSPLHPLNLISQRFGDLKRVRVLNEWLKNHPTPEKEPETIVDEINKQFRDLNWRANTPGEALAIINTARTVFPAFCGN